MKPADKAADTITGGSEGARCGSRPATRRWLRGALASLMSLAALLSAGAASAEQVHVEEVELPVTLSDGNTYTMAGHLYGRGDHTIQVLVHGATYDHRYWDAPEIDGHDYSYARHMAREGYSVLALDGLCTGDSDCPEGDFVTVGEAASALHQVMYALRQPHNPAHHRYHRIILVGHSLGSAVAALSEGKHHDADGLVLTGMALTPHPPPVDSSVLAPLLGTQFVEFPASLRAQLFYCAADADPAMIAYDNGSLATLVPRLEFLTGLQSSADPAALGVSNITEPVLVQLGENDVTAPGSLAPTEAAFYSGAASVTVKTVPGSGHAFNLHKSNMTAWHQIDDWLDDDGCDH